MSPCAPKIPHNCVHINNAWKYFYTNLNYFILPLPFQAGAAFFRLVAMGGSVVGGMQG
jgi:hypothetical protein